MSTPLGVASDRVVPHSDPEMRHGRESASRRFDGHKIDATTDEGSEMVLGVDVGEDRVELREAFRQLEGLGSASVLVGGGPRPNAQLVDDGLLDELCLTHAPRLVAGDYPPGLAGGELPEPLSWRPCSS